jgi:mitogen-activated protein kinase 1/3
MHYPNLPSTRRRYRPQSQLLNWPLGSDYSLVKQIGSGSYGVVCEAIHNPTGTTVAIKRISHLFDDVSIGKKLLREIAIMGYLDHPNVIRILDIIPPKDPDFFNEIYIVMEYAESDLKKICKSPIYFDNKQIKRVIYNILCGMKYIHSANIIHRDLKPANILINTDFETKICDFGFARTLPEEAEIYKTYSMDVEFVSGRSEIPRTHSLPLSGSSEPSQPCRRRSNTIVPKKNLTGHVVTRWYRAPELILLEKNYTAAVDVWSIGCVLAELCGMERQNYPAFYDRQPLFPGGSCFPLTPDMKVRESSSGFPCSNSDQIQFILNILGTPSYKETEFISDEKAKMYLRSFEFRRKVDFRSLYPSSESEVISLMERMLRFNPNHRISFQRALSSSYFEDVRDESKEMDADIPLHFDFEEDDCIDISTLRYYFLREIRKYHPI